VLIAKIVLLAELNLVACLASAEDGKSRVLSLFTSSSSVYDMSEHYSQCSWHSAYLFLKRHNVDVGFDVVSSKIPVNNEGGASLYSMHAFINVYLKDASMLKVDKRVESVSEFLPGIAIVEASHMNSDGSFFHSVFADRVESEKVIVYDPQIGKAPISVPLAEFNEIFTGIVISVRNHRGKLAQ